MDLKTLTIKKVHQDLLDKKYSVKDLVLEYKKNIELKNKEINAYLEVFDDILEQAENAQKMIDNGTSTLLTGIPFSIKDNILIKGKKAGASSKILESFIANYDATAIEKLKKEGVVFLGRVNMDEFAMGGSTENSAYGVTKNPYDIERVSGGSSGGSAASIAMDGALVSLGTDTGGSVRQPASFCGLVGLKPTYGAISRHGIMAMGSSLDQIGPMGKTVDDVQIIFNSIKGKDRYDSTSIDLKPQKIKDKYSIGIPKGLLENKGLDQKVLENFKESIEKLKKEGHIIKEVDLPNAEYALAVYYVIMFAEVSSNLSRFDGVKYGLYVEGKDCIDDYFKTRSAGFGKEVKRRIILGTYVLSSGYYDAFYNKANLVRELLKKDFENAFKEVDFVLTPTSPIPSFKIGEKVDDPVSMYLADIFTVTANLTELPAMSIPSGFADISGKKLPLGIQFTAKKYGEEQLFDIGKKFLGEK